MSQFVIYRKATITLPATATRIDFSSNQYNSGTSSLNRRHILDGKK